MIQLFHSRRRWFIAPVTTSEELATKLTEQTWTLCTAFELQGYIFLNDSTSEDGAQEYAVVKSQGDSFLQLESVTFGWMNRESALDFIRKTVAGEIDAEALYGKVELKQKLDTREEHGTCPFCA